MLELANNPYVPVYPGDDANTNQKKRPPRRNPWGNSSYADLITEAILSSPEKRLTLSQIYDWMIRNVPHFSKEGNSNSSAGWKNSIRHNLSLHKKFLRIKNEGNGGKSSWWTVNLSEGDSKTTRRKTSYKKKKNSQQHKNEILKKLSKLSANKDSASASQSQYESTNVRWESSKPYVDASERRWRSYSSNSSEDTSSFHSTSPLSLEPDTGNQDSYFINQINSTYTPPISHQNINSYLNETFTPNTVINYNATVIDDQNQLDNIDNQNNLESYYSLGNKFCIYYSSESTSPSAEEHLSNNPSPDFTEEKCINTSISREYFKSPHHLSGSYITSDVGRVNNFRNHISNVEKRNLSTFINSTPELETIQNSLARIDSYELNQKTSSLISSCLSQDLVPPVYHYLSTDESQNIVNTNILNEINDNSLVINYSTEFVHDAKTENEGLKYWTKSEDRQFNLYDLIPESKSNVLHTDDKVESFTLTEKNTSAIRLSTANTMRNKSPARKLVRFQENTMSENTEQPDTYDGNQNGHHDHSFMENGTVNMESQGSSGGSANGLNHAVPCTSQDSANAAVQPNEANYNLMRYVPILPEIFAGLYIPVGIHINYETIYKSETIEANVYPVQASACSVEANSCSMKEETCSVEKSDQSFPGVIMADGTSQHQNVRVTETRIIRAYITPFNEHENPNFSLSDSPNDIAIIQSLLLKFINVILVRVRIMSDSRSLVEYVKDAINRYSSITNIKQLLVFVTELYILIYSAYTKFVKATYVPGNSNWSSHFFINTKDYNHEKMKEMVNLVFDILLMQLKPPASENLLKDEILEAMSFPPDLDTYLLMYFKDIYCNMEAKIEINKSSSLAAQIYHKNYSTAESLPGPFVNVTDFLPEVAAIPEYTNENFEPSIQVAESYQPDEYNSGSSRFLEDLQLEHHNSSTNINNLAYCNQLRNNGNSIQYMYVHNTEDTTEYIPIEDLDILDKNNLLSTSIILEDFIREDGEYGDVTLEELENYLKL